MPTLQMCIRDSRMSPALRLGPLVFPIELALLVATAAVGLLAGRLLAGTRAEDAGRVLWRCLLLGLLVACLLYTSRCV